MAYYIYILTNVTRTTLYVGVTNDLRRRLWEHREEAVPGFTQRYHIHDLVYYEVYEDAYTAISREKELKKWRRDKKNRLVERKNPQWKTIRLEDL